MGILKGFLDLAVDFFVFVAACAFALSGFASTASIQNVLNTTLVDKGNAVIADAHPDVTVKGEEVIALLLLPEGVQSVNIDGIILESDIQKGVMYIEPDKVYLVTRDFEAESVKLIINKQ